MADKQKVNKTQAVREYLKAHRKASNQEVAKALAKKGITITANYIANIKATTKKRRRAVKKVVAKRGIGIPEIKAALALLKTTGSVAGANAALAAAQEIKEMM
jgi:arginine repressor